MNAAVTAPQQQPFATTAVVLNRVSGSFPEAFFKRYVIQPRPHQSTRADRDCVLVLCVLKMYLVRTVCRPARTTVCDEQRTQAESDRFSRSLRDVIITLFTVQYITQALVVREKVYIEHT
jgi:hypothetical protein